MAEEFLTVSQVAHRMNVSPNTVWRWVRERAEFPRPQKLGPRATRWRRSDIEAFEAQTGPAPAA